MTLRIMKQYDTSMEPDVYKLSTEMLNIKSTHLFIASNKWDKIILELDEKILPGYLKCLNSTAAAVEVILPTQLSPTLVQQLTEIYPEKSGLIRKAYMTGKSVQEVLGECVMS